MLSKIEGRRPLWSITTAVCGVFSSLIVFFNCCAWIVAAYRPEPMVPRWFSWLTLAGALTVFFAAGPAFFKSGPFAYRGLLAFYLPVFVWGGYRAATTWFMLKELRRERVPSI